MHTASADSVLAPCPVKGDHIAPDEDAAMDFYRANHAFVTIDGEPQLLPMCIGNADLGAHFGTGVACYFLALKWLRNAMLIMFLVNLPVIIINNAAKYKSSISLVVDAAKCASAQMDEATGAGDGSNEPDAEEEATILGDSSVDDAALQDACETANGTSTYSELISTALDTFTLESTTFALFDRPNPNAVIPECAAEGVECPEIVQFFGYEATKEDVLLGAALLDTLATLFFIVLTAVFAAKIRSLVKNVDEDVIEIADYTVYVKGLPSNVADPEEVRCFFELKFGKVADVQLAKADGPLLKLYFSRGKLKLKLDRMLGKLADKGKDPTPACDKLADKIQRLDASITKLRAQKSFKCVGAFVTFEREHSYMRCLKQSPRGYIARMKLKPEHRFRGEHTYVVTPADAPTNILYENLDVGEKERLLRRCFTNVVSIGLLLISFAVIYALTELQDQQQDTQLRLRAYSQYYTGTLGYEWNADEAQENADYYNACPQVKEVSSCSAQARAVAPARL